ncbi:MAG TPA: hypothetical protein VFI49_12010 [Rudaea sp.]|nr:hypothetical protein [Rudaea sp.]
MSGAAGQARRPASWLAIGALFALIASVRIGMVLAFAPGFPFFDEWDGVITGMAQPLRHGQFDPAYLLASHNGHPLLWTKLISLGFLWANGLRFDNLPVCVFNQIVYAFGCALLAWSVAVRLGSERGAFLLAALLMIVLPFDWENITMGWGNPYALLSFFSVGLIVACVTAQATLLGGLGIVMLGGAAAFSLGSGLVAPLIGAAVVLWRARIGEIRPIRAAVVAAFLIGWAWIAFAVGRTTHVTGQDAAEGLVQLAQVALLLLCWLPVWVQLRRYLDGERNRFDLAILCVALWAFVQILAMILERPRYFRLWLPISRYMDIIPVGLFAVMASLCRLARSRHGLPFALPATFARGALAVVAAGLVVASPLAIRWQLRWAEFHRDQARVLRAYLETGDTRVLSGAPPSSLAYPSWEGLKKLLDEPDTPAIIGAALNRSD